MGERRYAVTKHARQRLAERYSVRLDGETWQILAEQIEQWPYELHHTQRQGSETRVAHVTIEGRGEAQGTALVLPMVYLTRPDLVLILTVNPGGAQLRRRHHAEAT